MINNYFEKIFGPRINSYNVNADEFYNYVADYKKVYDSGISIMVSDWLIEEMISLLVTTPSGCTIFLKLNQASHTTLIDGTLSLYSYKNKLQLKITTHPHLYISNQKKLCSTKMRLFPHDWELLELFDHCKENKNTESVACSINYENGSIFECIFFKNNGCITTRLKHQDTVILNLILENISGVSCLDNDRLRLYTNTEPHASYFEIICKPQLECTIIIDQKNYGSVHLE